jgi:hypothetical protein
MERVMQTTRPNIKTHSPAEQFLAKLAAEFPDLVDPACKRSVFLEPTKGKDLIKWISQELKDFTQFAETDLRGSHPRIGRILLDRARYGKPIFKSA